MTFDWNYNKDVKDGFEIIPEGKYRIRVKSVEKDKSKSSGNDMLKLQFEVSGYSSLLFWYITFNRNEPDKTDRMLKSFYKSFAGVAEGDRDTRNWVGKVGACTVKHEEYNGRMTAKVGYLIPADKQDDLPIWTSPDGITANADGYMSIAEGADIDVPFE